MFSGSSVRKEPDLLIVVIWCRFPLVSVSAIERIVIPESGSALSLAAALDLTFAC
jgi:hypothetical protein